MFIIIEFQFAISTAHNNISLKKQLGAEKKFAQIVFSAELTINRKVG